MKKTNIGKRKETAWLNRLEKARKEKEKTRPLPEYRDEIHQPLKCKRH